MIISELLPTYVMPILLLLFALIFLFSKKPVFDSFLVGAGEGLACCITLLPTMILIMCGVGALFSSGAVDVLCCLCEPVLSLFKVPKEMLPSIILRPFSGSGVTAIADRMFKVTGPDSTASKTACLLMGSTDTIIYTLSMYFSAVGIKKTRHSIATSFAVFIFSILVCIFIGNLLYL